MDNEGKIQDITLKNSTGHERRNQRRRIYIFSYERDMDCFCIAHCLYTNTKQNERAYCVDGVNHSL